MGELSWEADSPGHRGLKQKCNVRDLAEQGHNAAQRSLADAFAGGTHLSLIHI